MSLAIIIPLKTGDYLFLTKFIPHIKNIDADIIVIEQTGTLDKGALFNIAVKESPLYEFYAFHDNNLVPGEVEYTIPKKGVLHLCGMMPRKTFFNGVVIISRRVLLSINGFAEKSGGLEYDNLRWRLYKSHNKFTTVLSDFEYLNIPSYALSEEKSKKVKNLSGNYAYSRYVVNSKTKLPLYTHIKVAPL